MEPYRPGFDIIFLDIEMPKLGGMPTAERIRRQDPDVVLVFVTNMAQYAIRGYEVDALDFVDQLTLTEQQMRIGERILKEIKNRLGFLRSVGLEYLTLSRASATLSGGEAQRVKLARELSKRGTGQTLYILDEPTTGLHFADIQQLLEVLHQLRDQGNTIVVIEHNLDVIKTADWIVDLGPEGGSGGGEILVSGTPETVAECEASHTARFLKPMLK